MTGYAPVMKQGVHSARASSFARGPMVALAVRVSFAITILAIFIPFHPKMPGLGLDASWGYGMNEAVARHMSFGKQMIFTYGPYASVITRVYHPATDRRMLLSSLFLGLSYGSGLLFLARKTRPGLIGILLALLVVFGATELAELSYALLLIACAVKVAEDQGRAWFDSTGWLHWLAALVMWSTLGLLPLVKESLLLAYAAAVAIPPLLMLRRRWIIPAGLAALVPVASTCMLWKMAGQQLTGLPQYLRTSFWLISGYTEAMSTSALVLPKLVGDGLVIVFLAAAGVICFSIWRAVSLSAFGRAAWMLTCAAFLFVIFKHGFVKADGLPSVYPSLAALALIAAFLHKDRYLTVVLVVSVALACGLSITSDGELVREVHERFGNGTTWSGQQRPDVFAFCVRHATPAYERNLALRAWNAYTQVDTGLHLRFGSSDTLEKRYGQAKQQMRSAYRFPALKGSVDIYNSEQSLLLANDVAWNPRPVLQSYSVYTPELIRGNEQHLRAADAPDWLFFDLTTIDGRWPSLDDGMSWPALFDNYGLLSFDGRYALLQRHAEIQAASEYEPLFEGVGQLGIPLPLPVEEGIQFAEIDLEATLAGKLMTLFFTPPQLRIEATLADGEPKRYRVVSTMMKTGFVISPLVGDTEEFARCVQSACSALTEKKVLAISIAPAYGGSFFWKKSFRIVIQRLIKRPQAVAGIGSSQSLGCCRSRGTGNAIGMPAGTAFPKNAPF